MTAFEDHMKELGSNLSEAARRLTMHVIEAEHHRRFSEDRSDLYEEFAHRALETTRTAGDER